MGYAIQEPIPDLRTHYAPSTAVLPRYHHVFMKCHVIFHGTRVTTLYQHGTFHDQNFLPDFDSYQNWESAWWCGYGYDHVRYYQEHDFVHHWIADRYGDGISEAIHDFPIWRGVKNEDLPVSIRFEENMVHRLQLAVRQHLEDGKNDHADFLVSHYGELEPDAALADLVAQMRECFGALDLMPGAMPKWCREQVNTAFHP